MKLAPLIGVALAVLIGLFWLMAGSLDSGRSAAAARERAIVSVRKTARVDTSLKRIEELLSPDQMKSGDLAKAVEAAAEDLRRISSETSQAVSRANSMAERAGLPAASISTLSADPASVQRSLNEFGAYVKANDALLQEALQDAAAAGAEAVLGVAESAGLAEYVRAAELLIESQWLREEQAVEQARLVGYVTDYQVAQGLLAHYNGLEVSGILVDLRKDVEELQTQAAESVRVAGDLEQQAADEEKKLAKAESDLKAASDARLALEQKGSTAGDDASFDAYRKEYQDLTAKMNALQQDEQILRFGGMRGAKVDDDDLLAGAISGGQEVVGSEELRRRATKARAEADRRVTAHQSLEERMRIVTEAGRAAKTDAERFQKQTAALETQMEESVQKLFATAEKAAEAEKSALQSAQQAAAAYGRAQLAVDAWMRDASARKSELDPNNQNARLQKIISDKYIPQAAASAEAAARVLAARVHAQALTANRSLVNDLTALAAAFPKSKFDPAPYTAQIQTAVAEAAEMLDKARQIYERLESGPAETQWIPQASLAGVHHLLAQIKPEEAAAHLAKAAEYIQKAVAKREQSPYLRDYVRLRDHLAGGAAPTPSKPSDAPSEPAPSDSSEAGG